ncbi:MAG: 2OG-Fe(II) oxygenase [Reinekea sp.]
MKAAAVAGYQGKSISDNRTNQVCWLEKNQDDMVFSVCQKISELVDRPLSHSERIQVIYYKKGEEFKPHFDAIRPVSVYTQESLTRMGGQRQLTALVYLNQVDAGGETYFPRLNIKQAPEFGSMLVFSNVKDGKRLPDPLSLHGAAPVKKGEKWAFNLWFRERETGV